MLKKELEKRYREVQKRDDERYWEINRLKKEIEDLGSKQNSLESYKRNLISIANAKADFLRKILEILLGKAQPTSKYEVIRDFFLEQIKEIESENEISDLNKKRNNHSYFHVKHLSERICEEGFE